VLPKGDAPTCTCALCAACIRPGVTGCTAATALRRVQSSTGIAGAGPTTSPCKPTASMHMSAASCCRAGALTRFIDARYGRTARTAGCRARALVRGGRNSSAWAQRRPRRHSFMAPQCSRRPCGGARPLPSSRACAWYWTGPPAHAHRGRPSDKQVGEAAVYVNRFLGHMHGETDRADCDAWDDPDNAEDYGADVFGRPLCRERDTEIERDTERERDRERERRTHTYTDAHAYTHTYTCVRAHAYMCTRTHTYMHAYTHIHTRCVGGPPTPVHDVPWSADADERDAAPLPVAPPFSASDAAWVSAA
jgi:hypothetical protein